MANKGTVQTNNYEIYSMAVDWEIESQSINGNYSTIRWRVYSKNSRSKGSWVYVANTRVIINGVTVYTQGSRTKGYGDDTFATGYLKVPHDNTGNKSITINIQSGIYQTNVNKYGSGTFELEPIPRGITELSLGKGWDELESTKTVIFKKLNSSVKIEMWWQYWDSNKGKWTELWKIRTRLGTEIKDYSSEQEFKLQHELIRELYKDKPNNSRADILLTLNVVNGDEIIQSKSITGNVALKTPQPSVDLTLNFTGLNQSLLKNPLHGLTGIHEMNVSVNARGINHANIKEVKVVFDNTNYFNKTLKITPSTSGDKKVEVFVTDSRGAVKSIVKWVKVIAYNPPTIDHRAYRTSSGSVDDPLGQYGRITGTINYKTIQGNSPWWRISLENNTKYTSSIMYSARIPVENVTSYEIEYGDKFSSSTVTGTIPSASVPLSVGKNSIGVGMVQPPDSGGIWIGGSSNDRRSINIVRDDSIMTIRYASGYSEGSGRGIIVGEKGQRGLLLLSNALYSVNVDTGTGTKKLLNL